MKPEDMGQLEMSKQLFLAALAEIPNRDPGRNRPLRDLVKKFHESSDCHDEMVVPFRLREFFPGTARFDDFIHRVSWS